MHISDTVWKLGVISDMPNDIRRNITQSIDTLKQRWHGQPRRTRRFVSITIFLIVCFASWQILSPLLTPPKKKAAAPVTAAAVLKQDVTVSEHSTGTVLAEATVNVTARVSGQIVDVAFREGQRVRKGDLLFRLDPRPLSAALAQAQATLAKDRATATSSERTFARDKALLAAKAISQQTYDADEASARADTATVQADKAAVDTARLNLDYASIRSPIDGKTGVIAVQIGNLVVANATTALVSVTQDQPVKISFTLPQDRIGRIQQQFRAGKLTAKITPDGGTPFTVPVSFLDNAVNTSAGTIELRASYANKEQRLVPGQMVSVDVTLLGLHNVLTVPHNALNPGQDGSFVFAIRQDKARQVPVTVLSDDGVTAAVSGKLNPGDQVVTDGQLRIEDGSKVHVVHHGPGKANPAQVAPGAQ